MKCSDFEASLESFLKGEISAEERKAAQEHLETCIDCYQIARIARGDFDRDPGDSREGFVTSVLDLTSGSTCERARLHLCDLVDGVLSPEYAAVVAAHLRTCPECSSLCGGLTELARSLPEMALVMPDPHFVEDVMARTSSSLAEVLTAPRPISRFLQRIFQRPRFSWEAAYVGTLLILMVWSGLTTSPVAETSSHRWASVQVSLQALASDVQRRLPEKWMQAPTQKINQEIKDDYLYLRQTVRSTLSHIRLKTDQLSAKSEEQIKARTNAAWKFVSSHLDRISERLLLKKSTEQLPPE